MILNSVGDLAQSMTLRRQGSSLRAEIDRLTVELSSGQKQDLARETLGDYSVLGALDHSLKLQQGYSLARSEMTQIFDQAQFTLGTIQSAIGESGARLLAATTNGQENTVDPLIADAGGLFSTAVSLLNTQVGGRFIFSGAAFDTPPLADVEILTAELQTATAGATTGSDFRQAVDDWFDLPGGGFETSGYLGAPAVSESVKIGQNQTVAFDHTASDDVAKEVLRNLAVISLVSDNSFAGSSEERNELLATAAVGLIAANDKLVAARAKIGLGEERLELAEVQTATERVSLETARNGIVSSDPFKVATELEEAQFQLQSLYLITSRTSRLNLAEYLR